MENHSDATIHKPVLTSEVLQNLQVFAGGFYIDCTLGDGGHTKAILDLGGFVLGIDKDPEAITHSRKRLDSYGERFDSVQGSFSSLIEMSGSSLFPRIDGILFDLGFSSRQIEEGGRGFSFKSNDPLDMRFDPGIGLKAADFVNQADEQQLTYVLKTYGEESWARSIAKNIVRERPFNTSLQLASMVGRVIKRRRGMKIHPATKTFQALRIHVNDEMTVLESGLKQAISLLSQGGRLAVISYHSLEDRIAKNTISQESKNCLCPPQILQCVCNHQATVKKITRKPIVPSEIEIRENPRSRSARLRVAERK
ncbi:MAG: 16S rRNA (cytosine(1402)-N(4))-methyltransferase RsmH [SAR202 cluster bacterium]|nr:16S rRNA (cytosine(1402)-N(4))-methyltransferase RsmH [SAR202 cluster bacterium]|tara:strand:+ start:4242 stop:5171 length:930 start_codon:yes stop_codon:yes gene_type:complete